jgi:uncharacterized membrane protein YesL
MASIFAADSALVRFMSRVGDVMILNLVFIASSVPIVTLGASLTALNFTAMRLVTGDCDSVTGDYFRSFRRNFRQATVIALVVAIAGAALVAWFLVVTRLVPSAVVRLILLGIWYLLALVFTTTLLYVFPYLAKFEGSTRQVLNNARLMSARHPLTTIVALIVTGLSVVVTLFYPKLTGYGLFWFVIGFAGIAVVNGVLFAQTFGRYVPGAPAHPDEVE